MIDGRCESINWLARDLASRVWTYRSRLPHLVVRAGVEGLQGADDTPEAEWREREVWSEHL